MGSFSALDASRRNVQPCARCGVLREARKTSPLCRDCKSCLTAWELRLWLRTESTAA